MKLCSLPVQFIFILAVCGCSININPSVADGPRQNAGVPWNNLHLTGTLVYNAGTIQNERINISIQSLNLITAEVVTIFQAPNGSWINSVAVSPDATQLLISYKPSISAGGSTALYIMPLDSSQPPQLLFNPPTEKDHYVQSGWSADGKYIYFGHINFEVSPNFDIMRMSYPGGKPELLIENGYWPRLSADGTHLVYVASDPESGVNSLFVSNADGTNAEEVPVTNLSIPTIIDAPMFSTDNQTILFSSPIGMPAYSPNLLDKLMGVRCALANGSLPSDWWSVPISGGEATPLTRLRSASLYGTYSPDANYIASYSATGIFVMKPDGTEVTMIVSDVGGIAGTVNWLP
jgi:Tol biopolymer transport system component